MKPRRSSIVGLLAVQAMVAAAFAVSYGRTFVASNNKLKQGVIGNGALPNVVIEREMPLRITPFYDDPEVVSDDELAAVLEKVRPRFKATRISPNHVEHALRTWHVDATFQDPKVMSGADMVDFLTDHGKYLASWGKDIEPLLIQRPQGVAIRWGRERGASVHHDHWLACLTEAGIALDATIFTPARRDMTVNDVLQEAFRDLRIDERETEWSAMAFGLWLPPAVKSWKNSEGREITFDLLATRLLRGHKRFGVCSGTHRVYSLMLLIRLDDDYQILSKPVRDEIYSYLEKVRDLIILAQFDDGRWPPNWSEGAKAKQNPSDDPIHRTVIATGHHLEWLAIAPKDLHPPHDKILKAADWIIKNVKEQTEEQMMKSYTFYSHVGNALALWRSTRAAEFWREWQKTHPYQSNEDEPEIPEGDKRQGTI